MKERFIVLLLMTILLTGGAWKVEAQDKDSNTIEKGIKPKLRALQKRMADASEDSSAKCESNFFECWIQKGMSMSEIKSEASSRGITLPERLMRQYTRYEILQMNDEELDKIVKDRMAKYTPGEISAVLSRLGDVNSWTSENITNFGSAVLHLPLCLDRAGDMERMKSVLKLIKSCELGTTPGCPTSSTLSMIKKQVAMRLMGSPDQWKFTDLGDLKVSEIPSFMIHHFDETFIRDVKDKLTQGSFATDEDQEKIEAWAKTFCEVEDCKGKSAAEMKTLSESLANFGVSLTPSDVSQEALEDTNLRDILEADTLKMKRMRAADTAILLKMKLDKETPETAKEIGGKLMGWAPACFMNDAAEKGELAAVRNQLSQVLKQVRGPEYKAKSRITMDENMKEASRNNQFQMNKISNDNKPFVRPELLKEQSPQTLLDVATKADDNNVNLTPYQMEVIVSKIVKDGSDKCPKNLCASLPFSFLKNLNQDYLTAIDRDIQGVSLPCLVGAEMMFTKKTELTVSDIDVGKNFLKCLSFKDANKVKESEIFDIFQRVKKMDLSWPACRAFKMKLMAWAENNLNVTQEDEVLENLYMDEIYDIPPCIVMMFEQVLYKLDMEKKKMVLKNLCHAKNYFTIPPKARGDVVNRLVKDTMEGTISQCRLEKLNNCFFDLDRSMLREMDDAASKDYVMKLEEKIREGVPDCLDSSKMDEVAEMLIRLKGPARTWKSAQDLSCILETSNSRRTEDILANLPDEVLITTECPMPLDPLMKIPSKCKEASEKAMMKIKRRKIEKCVKLRERFGTKNSLCDSLMCGNIERMTQSQLERMKKEDVKKYLDDLVSEELDIGKAKVILAKMKENKKLSDMSGEEVARLKYALRGLTKTDVKSLPTLSSLKDQELVYQLGMMKMLPDDVKIEIRDKIFKEFKKPEDMDSRDVFLLGDIMCYLTQNQTDSIKTDTIKGSLKNLGQLDCMNSDGIYNLAEAAKKALGRTEDWNAATVNEMNLLVSGLRPEDFTALPEEAFIGINPEAIKRVDPETLKVVTVEQVENLDGSTAASVTPGQMRLFTSGVRNALNTAKSEELRSRASGLWVSKMVGVVLFVLVLLL